MESEVESEVGWGTEVGKEGGGWGTIYSSHPEPRVL